MIQKKLLAKPAVAAWLVKFLSQEYIGQIKGRAKLTEWENFRYQQQQQTVDNLTGLEDNDLQSLI